MRTKILFFVLSFFFIGFEFAFAEDLTIAFSENLIAKFFGESSNWHGRITGVVQELMVLILTFEIVWIGIQGLLKRSDFAETLQSLVLTFLATTFFLLIIEKHQDWTWGLINDLSEIALGLARDVNAGADTTSSAYLFNIGLYIYDELSKLTGDIDRLIGFFAGVFILTLFCILSAKVVLIKCEAIVGSLSALILMAGGASKFMREYAIKSVRYMISIALKLFVLELLVGVASIYFLDISSNEITLQELSLIIGFSIVLFVLCNTLPENVATIISGSHISSGIQLASAAVGMTGNAITNVMNGNRTGAMDSQNINTTKNNINTGFKDITSNATRNIMTTKFNTTDIDNSSTHVHTLYNTSKETK